MPCLRFDDIEGIQAQIRPQFGPWGPPLQIHQSLIDQFAQVSGDHQWIHVDAERASRESPYGNTIAQGLLLLCVMSRLAIPKPFELHGFHHELHVGSDYLRFIRPVTAGTAVRGRMRLLEAKSTPKGTRLTSELAIHSMEDERPCVVYHLIVLYQ